MIVLFKTACEKHMSGSQFSLVYRLSKSVSPLFISIWTQKPGPWPHTRSHPIFLLWPYYFTPFLRPPEFDSTCHFMAILPVPGAIFHGLSVALDTTDCCLWDSCFCFKMADHLQLPSPIPSWSLLPVKSVNTEVPTGLVPGAFLLILWGSLRVTSFLFWLCHP